MTGFDESFRRLAARLVARAGTAVTLRRAGTPDYDPATGEVAATVSERTIHGVVEEVEAGHPDGLILRGDCMITVAAEPLDAEPAPGDGVVIAGTVHRVVSVSSTWTGDRPALFRLHVRR